MWGKIILPMYRLWLNGLYGPRCPLSSKRPINLISLSLSRELHFPLFRRWHYSTSTHGKLCWKPRESKPQKSKVIPVLDIIKNIVKEEITSVQYRLKCHSIFTLKKMLKAIKTFGIWNWACHWHMIPYMSSAQDQGNTWRAKVWDSL